MTVSVQGSACLPCSCSLPSPCLGPLRAARLRPLGKQLPNRVGFPCSGWQMLGPGISQEYSDCRILTGSSKHCNSQGWLTCAHQCSHLDLSENAAALWEPLGLWWLYLVVLSAAVWGMNFALPASGSEGKRLDGN